MTLKRHKHNAVTVHAIRQRAGVPLVELQVEQVSLEPGDVLFAFTDGVTEARDANGGFFTERRLLQLLAQPAPSAMALLYRIVESVNAHIGTATRFDDVTMLAARRKPVLEV